MTKAVYISPEGTAKEVEVYYVTSSGGAAISGGAVVPAHQVVPTDTYADFEREVRRTASCGFEQARAVLDEIERLGSTSVPLDALEDLIGSAETSVAGLGIAGEAGEVADLLKKHLGHGHELDREKLKKELGDVLWYTARIAMHFGFGLEDVARANVAKLRQRYPAGFSTEASKRRVDVKA
jgi:NTP pyrophosphatase (non-canonical NTP hydrolase)